MTFRLKKAKPATSKYSESPAAAKHERDKKDREGRDGIEETNPDKNPMPMTDPPPR